MSEEMVQTSEESKEQPAPESPADLRAWADQVAAHLATARQQLASLAAEQNALIIRAIDEGIELVRTAPKPDPRQVTREGLAALEEARQTITTLAQLPAEQLVELAKTQAVQAVGNATNLAGSGAAALLQAGTRLLDQVGKKSDELAVSVRNDPGLDDGSATAALVEFSRRLVHGYVAAQKGWIESGLRIPFIKSHVKVAEEPAADDEVTDTKLPVVPQ